MSSEGIIWLVLSIGGAASFAGGLVYYRGSTGTGKRCGAHGGRHRYVVRPHRDHPCLGLQCCVPRTCGSVDQVAGSTISYGPASYLLCCPNHRSGSPDREDRMDSAAWQPLADRHLISAGRIIAPSRGKAITTAFREVRHVDR